MRQQKGEAELLSYIFIILISIAVVAVIMTAVIPAIEQNKSRQNLELSKDHIDLIDSKIIEILSSPIGSSNEISINLNELYLDIDEDEDTIEIYHITNSDYYKDKLRSYEGRKYVYRDKQKLYSGIDYDIIDITTTINVKNQRIGLYFTKVGKNQIRIDTASNNTGN